MLVIAGKISADNSIFVADISMKAGEKQKIEICLNNTTTFMAFQFDLVLPEGISIAKKKNGKDDVAFNEDRKDDHTVTVNESTSGIFTFINFSMTNSPFYENEGALLYVTLQADENLSENKSASIKNIIFSNRKVSKCL